MKLFPDYGPRTADDRLAARRNRITRIRASTSVIMPWLTQIADRGRTVASTAITEFDVTARFTDTEDKIIALFSSLAAPADSETFATSSLWDFASPHDMVYRRLFSDVPSCKEYSVQRFRLLMDTLWQWSQDYGTVYDAFSTLSRDPDPLGTLQWMLADSVSIPQADYRLPRFLMALMLSDGGIGQGIMLHYEPENLTAPSCAAVNNVRRTFVPLQSIEYGEAADILGLQRETDLFYLALGWQDVCRRYPHETQLIKGAYSRMQESGSHNSDHRRYIRTLFRMLDI